VTKRTEWQKSGLSTRIISSVSGFLEAIVTLLPADAGGRSRPIAPRDGNYCPALRRALQDAPPIPIRFIEGPPWIAPGQDGKVVVEIEGGALDCAGFASGLELELVEGQRVVGILTVVRLWREAMMS
jgi:hypothetical protein